MKSINFLTFLLLTFVFAACEGDEDCCSPEDTPLEESWILFERGYSPGSGYIVEEVDEDPPQTMTFQKNGRFSSNIQGLEQFNFYLIIINQDENILALFEDQPTDEDQDLDKLQHSYFVEHLENHIIKLYFRFCIEGCHLSLRKFSN